MPALVLFGRRWLIASDDVPLPAAGLAVFHFVWCILLIIWFVSVHGPAECEGAWRYDVGVGGLLAAFVLSLGLEMGMVRHGLRGGPFETRKRRLLPRLIYLDIVSHVCQVAFNGYCTYLVYGVDQPSCEEEKIWNPFEVMQVLVWLTWAFIAAVLALLVLTYNLFPDYSDPKSWEARCNCLATFCCCSTGQARRGSKYTDLSGQAQRLSSRLGNLFAMMLSHIDMSPSDMLLAFSLAMALQRIQRKRLREEQQQRRLDDLLQRNGHDLETGLLGRRQGIGGVGSSSRGAPGELGTDRLESFVPRRPVADDVQLGAGKTPGGPHWQLQAGDSKAGEKGMVDPATIQEAAWAMKFAFASYGMLLYLFTHGPAYGCLQVCCGRNCGLLVGTAHGRKQRKKLDLRLMHNLNREATQQAAGLADRDLLDVRYEGEVPHVLPYFIAADEETKSVVVAIRGSLSLDDVIRDLLFEPASLDDWLAPGKSWDDPPPPLTAATVHTQFAAHAGILEAARATFIDIQASQRGQLEQMHGCCSRRFALSPAGASKWWSFEHRVLHDVLLDPGGRCHGWRLVLSGHSLGAGCAFLLGLYLRQFCPNLKCWAFSPPGGLASGELCAASEDWCTSCVCGKEWIPRLSLKTFGRMRDEMVFAALRCKRPKWLCVTLPSPCGQPWPQPQPAAPLLTRAQLPMEAREALTAYQLSVERNPTIRSFMEIAGDFGPPGRCFHLKPTGQTTRTASRRGPLKLRHGKQRRYRAVWIDGHSIIDEGVLISGRMMADERGGSDGLWREPVKSTAAINDRAGERLTEDVMEGMDERERRQDEDAAPSSGRMSRHGGRSESNSGGNGGRSGSGVGGDSGRDDDSSGGQAGNGSGNGNGGSSGSSNGIGSRSQQGGSRVGGITRPPQQEPGPQRTRLAVPPPPPPADAV
ncbi:hypothetical protein COHA_006895 [Chlorella ohadii]|uniref:sn-1-specific diacylglycerol lipase n=1 Tax=Chlorella ohadii TaxID=2649997 RepID=A0AAD5DP63_9CHLO|nr:hypothetical protein COHA_006895 [Chlorella ohadii]